MRQADGRSRRNFLKASSMLGLAAAFGPTTIGKAFADSKLETLAERNGTGSYNGASRAIGRAGDTAIRPSDIGFPAGELTDLRKRVNATSGRSGKR